MIKKNGFSLIEVLVTITILTVVGVAISTIVTRSFQSNTKTALIGEIKQSGQGVLAIIEKDIRESDTIVCPTSGTSRYLTLLTKTNGRYIRFFMFTETSTSNGSIHKEELTLQTLPANPGSLCDLSQVPYSGTQLNLTDYTSKTAISVKSTTQGFTVGKNPGFKDIVGVQFDLGPAIGSPTSFENSLGGNNSIDFQTIIQIR